MPIDLKRFLYERPPGGWPEEGRLVLDEEIQNEVRRERAARRRWMDRRLHPQTILPDNWKEDFRDIIYVSGRDLDGEDKAWLDAFLDHDETKTAFQTALKNGARWTEDLFLHIFIVCKPSSFRVRALDAILENKDSAQKNQKAAIALSKYVKRVDVASRRAGELFGTMDEAILRSLASHGITITSTLPDPDLVSNVLAIIGNSFGHHIRRSFRGPKFDHRAHLVAVSLASLFRRRFNGNPLSHVVASLRNAALPDREAIEVRDVENILKIAQRKAQEAGLQESLPGPTTPPKKRNKAISVKKRMK